MGDYVTKLQDYGHVWSTTAEPTISVSDKKTQLGEISNIGTFTSSLSGLHPNTTYYVRAYATNAVGTSYGEQITFKTTASQTETHEYVDLGLPSGTLWATTNVGAELPADYGDYFAWGETVPKSAYNWSTYKWCNGSSTTMTKYCTRSLDGTVDNKTRLESSDDAATANWGGNWCMPTIEQQEELMNPSYTTCTWITMTNSTFETVNGYKIVSKSNGNSLFLPIAGHYNNYLLSNTGVYGTYWSSTLYSGHSDNAYFGFYNSTYYFARRFDYRYTGMSVRPVRTSAK